MIESQDRGIIDGKAVAREIIDRLSSEIEVFAAGKRAPVLKVLLAGDDPASRVYTGMKVKDARRCGIDSELIELPRDVEEGEVLDRLDTLNSDPGVDGILVQLPLPPQIEKKKVIERISPMKDVDGFHPFNLGRLVSGDPGFVPCTPKGIIFLLDRYGVEIEGKRAVVVGRSIIVGKPMALLLSMKAPGGNATVTICHSRTPDLGSHTSGADILIAAAGRPGMIKADMVKEGAVVIDVGTNRVDDPSARRGYRLTGDVEFESVRGKASLITPVPGGVGPMTRAMLMENTFLAARSSLGA